MVTNIASASHITEADELLFKQSRRSLGECQRPRKRDLYGFLSLPKTASNEELASAATSAIRKYDRTRETSEKQAAGLAATIFRNKRPLYDLWLSRISGLPKILKKADELRKIAKSYEKYLDAIDLRIVIQTSAYPDKIDPITAASHLESNGYRLDRTIYCYSPDCGSLNHFYHYRCSACNAGLDARNKKATDDSVDDSYRSWLDTQAGFIWILNQAEIYAGPGKNLEVMPLRKITREAAIPWAIETKYTAQYLKDLGYKVETQIKCPKTACSTLNDFFEILCSKCGDVLGDGQDWVLCPHGHKSPNLTRYCAECHVEILYLKPVMPSRILNGPSIKSEEATEQSAYTALTRADAEDIWSSVRFALNEHGDNNLRKIGRMLETSTIDSVSVDPKRLKVGFTDLGSQQEFFRFIGDPGINEQLELVIKSHFDDEYAIQRA